MTHDDFDITFCNGEVKFSQNGIEAVMICPVRDKCHRFWTEEHSKESIRLGCRLNSFFMLTDPNDLTDAGCDHFWSKD